VISGWRLMGVVLYVSALSRCEEVWLFGWKEYASAMNESDWQFVVVWKDGEGFALGNMLDVKV